MRTSRVLIVSTVLGLTLGLGMTYARVSLFTPKTAAAPKLEQMIDDKQMPDLPPAGSPMPVAVFPETKYDFGLLEFDSKRSHTFIVRNEGKYPLVLKQGGTTCKCTISSLDNESIAPGGEGEVTLEWTARSATEHFRQSANIYTNDPENRHVVLVVTGKITATVIAHPPKLNFGTVLTHEPKDAESRVYTTGTEPLNIENYTVTNDQVREFVDIDIKPMTTEEAQALGGAQGFIVRGHLKPGLPLGAAAGLLEIKTSLTGVDQVRIGIEVNIAADVSLVGPQLKMLDSDRAFLEIGRVPLGQEKRIPLKILARGPQRDSIEYKIAKVEPSLLKVHLGEPRAINQGNVIERSLEIEVPADAPAMNYRGSPGTYAEIVLETTHPQTPQITLRIELYVN
jgi:hypothetical protein